jgi:hypothetical protein
MEDQVMYKTLGGIGAALMLVMIAAPATAGARRQEPGIQKQAVGEEFSSKRRRYPRAYEYYHHYGLSLYRHAVPRTLGCAGQTVRPSLHSISQTSAGKLSMLKLLSFRAPICASSPRV